VLCCGMANVSTSHVAPTTYFQNSLQVRGSLTAEALRDRTAALASAFVVPLLRHAARSSCGVLWDAALDETRRRLQLLQGCEAAGEDQQAHIKVSCLHMVLWACSSCIFGGPTGSLRQCCAGRTGAVVC
jgi:hypothetical protein